MTSHGEALSLAAFWKDAPNADRQGREWLEGPRIALNDLLHGSARIERVSAAGWWSGFQRVVGPAAGDPAGRGGSVAGTGQAGTGVRQSAPQRTIQVPRDQSVIRGRATGKTGVSGRPPKPLIFPFGNRHKGRLAIEVKEEDPSYWQWSITRADAASWWRPMAAKAGLLDDEDES